MKPDLKISVVLLVVVSAPAQSLLGGSAAGEPARLLPSDAAILESAEARRDFPCSLKPIAPELGFDLGFHSGYEVSIPVWQLAQAGSRLTAIFRVKSGSDPGTTTYFFQNWTVPQLDEGAGGTAHLRGSFILGEGQYQVDWLLRDQAERYCGARWDISAKRRGKDRAVELSLSPSTARPESADLFVNESTAKFEKSRMLNVVVLFHVAPQTPGAAGMQAHEAAASVGILRNIARDAHIGTYSVAAFNLEQNKLIYRRDAAPMMNFRAMGERIKQLHLGTVTVANLQAKNSSAEFLNDLVAQELRTNKPDALILVGSRIRDDTFAGSRAFSELQLPSCPVFYLSYDSHANTSARDLIGSAVKLWKGKEFTITTPRDLSFAWTEVISRLLGTTSIKTNTLQPTAATNLLPVR